MYSSIDALDSEVASRSSSSIQNTGDPAATGQIDSDEEELQCMVSEPACQISQTLSAGCRSSNKGVEVDLPERP
jgi:hypothetical protein